MISASPAPPPRTYRADTAVVIDVEGAERTGVLDGATSISSTRDGTRSPSRWTAFSRFSRYFTEQVDDFRIPSTADGVLERAGIVPRSVHITVPGEGIAARAWEGLHRRPRAPGTVSRVPAGTCEPTSATPCATSRWRCRRSSVGEAFGTATVVVPGGRATFAPVVADVVPRRDPSGHADRQPYRGRPRRPGARGVLLDGRGSRRARTSGSPSCSTRTRPGFPTAPDGTRSTRRLQRRTPDAGA